MVWVLEQIFGANVVENPYYEIMQDITNLVPWWYPHFIAGCTLLFLILLWDSRRRRTRPTIRTSSGTARPEFANTHREGRQRTARAGIDSKNSLMLKANPRANPRANPKANPKANRDGILLPSLKTRKTRTWGPRTGVPISVVGSRASPNHSTDEPSPPDA